MNRLPLVISLIPRSVLDVLMLTGATLLFVPVVAACLWGSALVILGGHFTLLAVLVGMACGGMAAMCTAILVAIWQDAIDRWWGFGR